jgi:hypothetical protein
MKDFREFKTNVINKLSSKVAQKLDEKKQEMAKELFNEAKIIANKMKYYYALTDSFTGDNPAEPTSGFANTKRPLAFRSKKERDAWLKTTKLQTARSITQREALKLAKWETGEYYGSRATSVKVCRVYGTGEGMDADYVILAESEN